MAAKPFDLNEIGVGPHEGGIVRARVIEDGIVIACVTAEDATAAAVEIANVVAIPGVNIGKSVLSVEAVIAVQHSEDDGKAAARFKNHVVGEITERQFREIPRFNVKEHIARVAQIFALDGCLVGAQSERYRCVHIKEPACIADVVQRNGVRSAAAVNL